MANIKTPHLCYIKLRLRSKVRSQNVISLNCKIAMDRADSVTLISLSDLSPFRVKASHLLRVGCQQSILAQSFCIDVRAYVHV